MQPDASNPAPRADMFCWRDEVLERVSVELHETAKKLVHFQNDLSSILARAHVSAGSIQKLQALDETTQILDDLARVVQVVSEHGNAPQSEGMSSIVQSVNLGGLRSRLYGETAYRRLDEQNGDVSFF